MEIKDKYDIVNWMDEVKNSSNGKAVKILSDVFLIRTAKDDNRGGNTYAIRHENQHDLLLIDAVLPEDKAALDHFVESGYNIKGIIVTSDKVARQAFADFKKIAKKYNTSFYMHKIDDNSSAKVLDVMEQDEVLKQFEVEAMHFPGYTGGSVLVYSKSTGALFTGNSAIGSHYDEEGDSFTRPEGTEDTDDYGLAENYENLNLPFDHILPGVGKPKLHLDEDERNTVKDQLTKR